jgi:hypothetical protein
MVTQQQKVALPQKVAKQKVALLSRCHSFEVSRFAKSANVETKAASYDSTSVSRATGVVWLS